MNPRSDTLKVLPHAIAQYRARFCPGSKRTDEQIANKLRKIVAKGKEFELKPERRLTQLLNHDCQLARYYKAGPVFVVVADGLIKTVHNAAANRWVPKKSP